MAQQLIKICGLSTPETVDAAVEAGATHIGLIHCEASPRHVTLDEGAALRRRVPPSVKVVLLTVNMQPEEFGMAHDTIRPDIVQFHGRESVQWLELLRRNTSLEIWKAVGVKDRQSLEKARKFAPVVHRIIYDAAAAAAAKLPGGNGVQFDWSLMDGFDHEVAWGLAGGLTPETVADAILATGAPLVDASSGIESDPGVKDVDLIRAFCEGARSANPA